MKNAGIVPAENEAAEIVSIEQTHTMSFYPLHFVYTMMVLHPFLY